MRLLLLIIMHLKAAAHSTPSVRVICQAEDHQQAHDAAARRQSRVKSVRQLGIAAVDRMLHIEDVC